MTPETKSTKREFIQRINSSPILISALYDLDLLPEQVTDGATDEAKMLMLSGWYFETQKLPELIQAVLQWGIDRQITGPNGKGTLMAQANKLMEEAAEVYDEIEMMDSGDSLNPVKLEIGDVFVSAILLCDMLHLTPDECLQAAYDKISKRDGKIIDGTFVKNK